jgi:hypothetical protein
MRGNEMKKMNSKCEVEVSILQMILLCPLARTFPLFVGRDVPHWLSIQVLHDGLLTFPTTSNAASTSC